MEHGHEVALAGTEAAVQVCGLRGVRFKRSVNQAERIVEALRKLRRNEVVADGLLCMLVADTFSEAENEVAFVDPLRDLDEVAKERAHATTVRARRPRVASGGRHAAMSFGESPSSASCPARKSVYASPTRRPSEGSKSLCHCIT